MSETFFIARDDLAQAFPNMRAVRQFETMQQRVEDTAETTGANVEATGALAQASFVTLSPNAELPNEYVLQVGEGLALTTETGVLRLTSDAPVVDGGFRVRLIASADSELVLPPGGVLSTRDGQETLRNKELEAPYLAEVDDYADDAAAAAGGVEIGQLYRTGSAVMVRVA